MAVALKDLVKTKGPLSLRQLKLIQRWLDEDWEANDQDANMVKLVRRLLETCKRGETP